MRLTKQRKAVIERLRAGSNILSEKTEYGGHIYAYTDGGNVSQDVIEGLIAHGALRKNSDGLFGDGQTLSLAEGLNV